MIFRVILAAVLGGIVLFLWEFVYHEHLKLGDLGMSTTPNEEAVMGVLRANLADSGLYHFPGGDAMASEEELQAWDAKFEKGPSGLLVYRSSNPGGLQMGLRLGRQLGIDVLTMLIVAGLLSLAAPALPRYVSRVLFVAVCGILAGLAVPLPNWNWYDFPLDFTLAIAGKYVAGYLLAGIVMAIFIRHKPQAAATT